mmetsp:Transcript_10933/g.16601  ORF Transcript_10933/g.16601 Transcript_10933/m.16601 type:complete len:138 (+) Transcript_10933:326-739(+)|eukprot:CAMPEP_0170508168 /NCGR_PEP_ID=MMETSP0208-20121228/61518_1 /TAXON_ID=197538 /ORGANISM="Strombidium inclinatum, Strain S3" /LENGTH=137 /DNA_ID=CAMNT_0010790923 /DNA_START=328 /DNA_END=741 /DNA_ORIENTATION=+
MPESLPDDHKEDEDSSVALPIATDQKTMDELEAEMIEVMETKDGRLNEKAIKKLSKKILDNFSGMSSDDLIKHFRTLKSEEQDVPVFHGRFHLKRSRISIINDSKINDSDLWLYRQEQDDERILSEEDARHENLQGS